MSDSSSPPRKRRRMSSPTYDEQLEFPSQDELTVIGQLELSLSQVVSHYHSPATGVYSQGISGHKSPRHVSDCSDRPVPAPSPTSSPNQHLAVGHHDDGSNDPFTSTSGSFTGFVSASTVHIQPPQTNRLLPDPGGGQNEGGLALEPVWDAITSSVGFTSASDLVTPSVGFTSASALGGQLVSVTRYGSSSPSHEEAHEDSAQTTESDPFVSLADSRNPLPFAAFTSLGKQKNLFQPSAAAMQKALEKANLWAVEDDGLFPDHQDDSTDKMPDVTISSRQALQAVEEISARGTSTGPTASGSSNEGQTISGHATVAYDVSELPSLGQVGAKGSFRSAACFSTPSAFARRPFQTPSVAGIEGNAATKPFKSPLQVLNSSALRNSVNPQDTPPLFKTVARTPTREPKLTSSFSGAVNTSRSILSTPVPIRGTPIHKPPTKKFVTPFKPGMRPGEPGHIQLKAHHDAERVNATPGPSTESALSLSDGSRKPKRRCFFDLSAVHDRKTLASSGFRPGTHSSDALAKMGINADELRGPSLRSAMQHRFHVSPQGIPSVDVPFYPRGPVDALRELKEAGCHLATQEWVDNHWSLILWKLAGMAALDPESEVDINRRRWSWTETVRQLRYRYEKELNCGARPALRLIAAQDVSAGLHMILCISDIIWSGGGMGDDGLPLLPHPVFELTDGWYRLRARVDEVLARAARRGVIRIGRKISVSGASLPRNTEPCEILEAYDKVELDIAGNGTHLAPWHAKLGFQPRPSIATLHTLLPEGGMVPCLQLVVTKVYPIAFIEFRKGVDGKVTREGPRREKEELAAHDVWLRKREREYQRLRKEAEKKQDLFLDWAQRFEAKAGPSWHPKDDEDMPVYIESMLDDCEYASDPSTVLRCASRTEAGWLAHLARERAMQETEALEVGLEHELQSACPPREVRNFRVLLMRDARATRRPARRVVELTVWDVLSLALDGASAGQFGEGQAFQVTNLLPTQKNAWMDRSAEGAHVYLSSSKTSRWMKL